MELRRYYTTALEDWVTRFYTRLKIFAQKTLIR
jgi:hypothetical protein